MRTMRSAVAWTVVLALIGGSPAGTAAQDAGASQKVVATREVSFTDDPRKHLDVFAPSEPGPWPVVVIVPGAYQHRTAYEQFANAIASQGAVVFNVGVDAYDPLTQSTGQVACAVRHARATAADHGGDPDEVTLVGHSAGAVVGMVVAMAGDGYADDCMVTDGSAMVDVLVGYEGPFDWATTSYGTVNHVPLRESDPDRSRAIDPYAHIGGNPALVVRLVHGDDAGAAWYDVPIDVSVGLDQSLREAGYDTELTVVEGAGHGGPLTSDSEVFDVMVEQALHSTD